MRVALALALVACTTTKTAEQHAEVGLETRKVERVETHTEEGEWSVKTWEFAPRGGVVEPSSRAPWWPVIPRVGPLRGTPSGVSGALPPSSAAGTTPGQMPSAQGHDDGPRLHGSTEDGLSYPSDAGYPSFLGWPMDGDAPVLRYTEEVHSPTKTTSLSDAEQQTTLKVLWASLERFTRSWWPPAWLLACLALGAAVALWALRRKIGALKGLL